MFLLVSAWLLGWRDIGLNAPRPASSLKLFWLVALYLLLLGGLAMTTGIFTTEMLVIIAINTAFVGLSEELAFRGLLWGAARKALSFWVGVIFVSAMFGSVHLLNALITGQLGEAGLQSLNALLSGIAYLALRIRTRSLLPIMVAHWLWDLAIFLSASGVGEPTAPDPASRLLLGILLVGPIALHGLWLLRRREFQHVTDALPSAEGSSRYAPIITPKEATS